jgi:hypothetical protein
MVWNAPKVGSVGRTCGGFGGFGGLVYPQPADLAARFVASTSVMGYLTDGLRGNVHPMRQGRGAKGALRAANCIPRGKPRCQPRGKVRAAARWVLRGGEVRGKTPGEDGWLPHSAGRGGRIA